MSIETEGDGAHTRSCWPCDPRPADSAEEPIGRGNCPSSESHASNGSPAGSPPPLNAMDLTELPVEPARTNSRATLWCICRCPAAGVSARCCGYWEASAGQALVGNQESIPGPRCSKIFRIIYLTKVRNPDVIYAWTATLTCSCPWLQSRGVLPLASA